MSEPKKKQIGSGVPPVPSILAALISEEERAVLYWQLYRLGPNDPEMIQARRALCPGYIPAYTLPPCSVPPEQRRKIALDPIWGSSRAAGKR